MKHSPRVRAEAELEELLRAPGAVAPGALIGIEHEYVVRRGGAVADFRELIHSLPVPGRRLDPGDCNAYRLPSGLALTCDEAEAEIATPPLCVMPGFPAQVNAWAAFGRNELERLLPQGDSLTGYSTHISVALPGERRGPAAALYARTFAPALALILEQPQSQGVYVRPRPERLELCGEYASGAVLKAASVFAVGSVTATDHALSGDPIDLPELDVETLPCRERYGLRVTRLACGTDLYAGGRKALLRTSGGRTIRAQDYLVLAWAAAKQGLRGIPEEDWRVVEDVVFGRAPLGVEGTTDSAAPVPVRHSMGSPEGRVVERYDRPGYFLEASVATWAFTVFRARARGRVAYLNVPRSQLGEFFALLEAGRLDAGILSGLESPGGRRLESFAQVSQAGIFSGLGDPADLLVPEQMPEDMGDAVSSRPAKRRGKTPGRKAGPRPGKPPGRAFKVTGLPGTASAPVPAVPAQPLLPVPPSVPSIEHEPSPPVTPPAPAGRPPVWAIAIGLLATAAVVVAGVVTVLATSDDPGGESPVPTPTFQRPTETAVAAASPSVSAPSATPTPPGTSTPTVLPSPKPTETALPTVAGAVLTPTPTSTSIPVPTETVIPATATPTKFATETPRPTPTPTKTPTPTSTPTPTARPTATPTRVIDVPPATSFPTAVPGCTPVGGAVCQ